MVPEAGTHLVKDVQEGPADGDISSIVYFDRKAIFKAFNGISQGLWISDGTEVGTQNLSNVVYIDILTAILITELSFTIINCISMEIRMPQVTSYG